MIIIPVIDLSQGQVVHAVRGQRERYRPVQSTLCTGSDPATMVQAFLELYPFATIYIADLDAIRGNGDNTGSIRQLECRFKHLELWVDNGCHGQPASLPEQSSSTIPVIGSETGVHATQLRDWCSLSPRAVLSLDFMEGRFLGDATLLSQPDAWPANIIIMNLTRVGTRQGPDLVLLDQIKTASPGKKVFSAGGVSDVNDLQSLNTAGCAGVLMATALHAGRITSRDISVMMTEVSKM